MAIGGLVLFSIGSAIAKHIVKSWLDSDLLDELAGELIDLVKDQGKQTAEQRRQQKDVDKLATAMSSRMRQIYNISKLRDNSKQAIAAEVALTLSKSNLTIESVISHNMDAEKLARQLLDSRPDVMKQFSIDETALYERLISEAAYAQVQISGLLESFTGAFATKVLKDNERLLSMVEKLLQEPDEKSKQFLIRYKETVKRKLDQLEVFGLPKLDRYSRQLSLSVAYISLDAEPRNLDVEFVRAFYNYFEEITPTIRIDDDALSISKGNKIINWLKRTSTSEHLKSLIHTDLKPSNIIHFSGFVSRRPNSIESVLGNKRRIVVQGQAGSGKTTLLQWLAVRAVVGDFEPPLSSWNQEIPFFIRLREYVNRGFPTLKEFLEKTAPMIVDSMPTDWVHNVLDSGHGLVLVDGVDELPSDQREAMLIRLSDLVATYPASRYVISSRPAALKEQLWPQWKEWVEAEGFVSTTLRDMDSVLVAAFIDQWHEALASGTDDEEEQIIIKTHATSLKSLLNGRPPLRRLAKNPLLCAMICALFQERLQNLPNERLKLYEECVEMLLTRRDEGRRVPTNYDYPSLTLSQRLSLLQDLSYWMITNGYSDVEVDLTDQRFERKLPALSLTDNSSEKVRRLFVDRTNLLREPVVGRIDFTHLTFQEYLAAKEAVEEGSFGVLTKHAGDDTWREVIVLALGIARQKEREKVLRAIIRKSRQKNMSRAKRKQLALLALACLETSTSLDPTLREEIIQNATFAIPPTDDDETKLVASAGDPAIQLLTPKESYSEEQTVFCIKTLALIGSEKAMTQLASFANDARSSVGQALVTAWDNFDRDQYAQTVLVSLDKLTIGQSNHLRGIKHLKQLVSLSLLNVSLEANELAELSMLPNLAELTIRLQKISNVSNLARIKNLRKLSINSVVINTEFPDLSNLAQLSQLTYLKINAILPSTPLTPISRLSNLVELSLSLYRGEPPDLESLQLLTNLRKLTISTNKTPFDLQPIAGIVRLTALHINSRIVPDSFKSLANLSNLLELSIPIPVGMDLTALAALTNLTNLDIEVGNNLDFSQLSHLQNLRSLKIISRKLLDISSISVLNQLSQLDLSQCKTDDITPLGNLTNLTNLKLRHGFDLKVFRGRESLQIEEIESPDLITSAKNIIHFATHGNFEDVDFVVALGAAARTDLGEMIIDAD